MREVANRLERMGCINRDIRLAIAITGPHSDRLLTLRADFSFEANQLLNQLTLMFREHNEARVASRIFDAFVTMQQLLIRHQQKWSPSDVKIDPEGYLAASHNVHAAVINFLEEALDVVEETTWAARTHSEGTSSIAEAAPIRLTVTR